MKQLLFAAALAALFSSTGFATPIWGTSALGELSGSRDAPDLVTSGTWADDFTISWDVNAVDDGWVYSYALLTEGQDVSHFLLEVTEDSPEPIVGHNGEFLDPQWWDMAGNLALPDDLFGVKADHGATFYSFFSDRAPVYGSFFAKSGSGGDQGWTYAHNAGFDNHLSSELLDFIVRPDGGPIPTPEPASALLLGLGVAWIGIRRRGRP